MTRDQDQTPASQFAGASDDELSVDELDAVAGGLSDSDSDAAAPINGSMCFCGTTPP